MLELFDTAGHRVNIASLGIKYFVPTSTSLAGTIDTVDASTLMPSLVAGSQMIVTVHVDNNPTDAEIDAPMIGGSSADPCCGVLTFSPGASVTLPGRAKQKNGFATWSLSVKRVDALVYSASDPVGLVGSHSTTQTVNTLLTTNLPPGCTGACAVAGFATHLYVDALATDGWRILEEYDRLDFEAFVLSSA